MGNRWRNKQRTHREIGSKPTLQVDPFDRGGERYLERAGTQREESNCAGQL